MVHICAGLCPEGIPLKALLKSWNTSKKPQEALPLMSLAFPGSCALSLTDPWGYLDWLSPTRIYLERGPIVQGWGMERS